MRNLAGFAVAISLALATIIATPGLAEDPVEAPSAVELERLLRETLTSARPGPWTISMYRRAKLLDFSLRRLSQLGTYSWWAEVALEFDFGPPTIGVIGFESRRQGLYRLYVDKQTGEWRLDRFNPVGDLQLLPAGGS